MFPANKHHLYRKNSGTVADIVQSDKLTVVEKKLMENFLLSIWFG